MVLRMVTAGMMMNPRGDYNLIGGHRYRCRDPGVVVILFNSWVDCVLDDCVLLKVTAMALVRVIMVKVIFS